MRVEVGGRFRDSTYIGSNAPVDFAIRPYIPLSSNRSVECWTTTSPEHVTQTLVGRPSRATPGLQPCWSSGNDTPFVRAQSKKAVIQLAFVSQERAARHFS